MENTDNKEYIIEDNFDGHKILRFKSKTVKNDIIIEKHEFSYANFEDIIFEGQVILKKCKFLNSVSFKNSEFKNIIDLEDCTFKSKTRFLNTKFENTTSFHNTRFEDLADFWNADFYKDVIFFKTDFFGVTVFSQTKFHKNVLFTYSHLQKNVIFQGTYFNKGFDLALSLISGSVHLFNITIKDYLTEEDDTEDDEFKSTISLKNKRETFRILKNVSKMQNNYIDALNFLSEEHDTYYRQLKNKLKTKYNGDTLIDLSIFWLNKISNNNRKSWTRGVLFTFCVAILFFGLIIFSMANFCFCSINFNGNSFKYFIEFINPIHKIDYLDSFLESLNPNSWSYLLDFLGRIFVSYGIYQTVQAFRKFMEKV